MIICRFNQGRIRRMCTSFHDESIRFNRRRISHASAMKNRIRFIERMDHLHIELRPSEVLMDEIDIDREYE